LLLPRPPTSTLFPYTTLFRSQNTVEGTVFANGNILPFSNVYILENQRGAVADENGNFKISGLENGNYSVIASFAGYAKEKKTVILSGGKNVLNFNLNEDATLDAVVISGTMKAVTRHESPVPVEVYSPTFLKKNPTPNIFEALQNVNGVRPQLNCNVCNSGDIHINGLEGPYTLVLIDGMPIVSGLSTVYGLSGIPNSLIEGFES